MQRRRPPAAAAAYRIAGRTVVVSPPLADLEPFAAAGPLPRSPPAAATGGPGTLLHRGEVWFGGGRRPLECWRLPAGFVVRVDGAEDVLVAAGGSGLSRIGGAGAASPRLADAMLGPGLVLALALQDVWCLHAGGATLDGRAIALVGESGAGKSTLAAALGRQGGRWRPLADDLLPVALDGERPVALPRFPQARLAAAGPPGCEHPERMELAAVVLLAPPPADGRLALDPVEPRRAALALVRHTFASCLFDRERLARHLAACADLAGRVPVRSLVYPRRQSDLAAVAELLEHEPGRRPGSADAPARPVGDRAARP